MKKNEEPLFELSKCDLGVHEFAAEPSDRQHAVQNILVHINSAQQIEMIATDGFVAIKHRPRQFVRHEFDQFLIPATTFQAISRVIGLINDYSYAIKVYSNRIELTGLDHVNDLVYAFRPIGGVDASDYPDVDAALAEYSSSKIFTAPKLNVKFLLKLSRFVSSTATDGKQDLVIKTSGKLAPVIFENSTTYIAVMPLKH